MARLVAAQVVDPHGRPIFLEPSDSRPRRTIRVVASGAPLWAGLFNWDDPPELRTPEKRHETYRKMAQSDAYIAESLRENSLPLLSRAVWDVAPGVEVKPKPEMLKKAAPPAMLPGFPPRLAVTALEDPEENEDTRTPEEKLHAEIAEFVGANLYGKEGDTFGWRYWTDTSWTQRLREILKFLEHGFAVFHRTSHVVEGKRCYRRLLWLEPSTIIRWVFDREGYLQGIERRYISPVDGHYVPREEIPASELALYVWDAVGMRIEGTALIRPMFGAWVRKEFVSRCKMIAIQRAGVGMPWAKRDSAQDGSTDDLADRIEEFLQSSFGSGLEHQYLSVDNPSLELGYFQQDAEDLEKFEKLGADENLSIAHGGSTKSGMLGEIPGGTRGLGEVQQVDKYVLVEAIGQVIAEQELRGVAGVKGVIRELVQWNWGDVDRFPYLRLSNVDPYEPTRNLPMLKDQVTAGVVKHRPQLEKMVLDRLGFELPEDAFEDLPAPGNGLVPPGQGDPRDPQAPPPKRPDPPRAELALAASDARRLTLRLGIEEMLRSPALVSPEETRTSGYRRTPTEFEQAVMALGVVATALTQGSEQMAAQLRRAHRQMIEDLVGRGRAGKVNDGTLTGLRRSAPKGEAELLRRVREQFLAIATTGRQHSDAELERQKSIASEIRAGRSDALFEIDDEDEPILGPSASGALPKGSRLPKPSGRPLPIPGVGGASGGGVPGVDPLQVLFSQLAGEARVTAEISIDSVWQRLVGEAISEWQRLSRTVTDQDALWNQIEAHLHALTEKPIELAGRKAATVAYNEGRDLSIKAAAIRGEAEWFLVSELLDDATCEVCARRDGSIYQIGSPAGEQNLPPAGCLGGEKCRGVPVVIGNVLVEAEEA